MDEFLSSLDLNSFHPPFRIASYDKVVFNNVEYSHVSSDLKGAVLRRMDGTNVCEGFTQPDLAEALHRKTDPMVIHPGFYAPVRARARLASGDTVSALPIHEQQQLVMKLSYVLGWKRMKAANTEAIRKARIDRLPEPVRMTKSNDSLEAAVAVLFDRFIAAQSGGKKTTYKSEIKLKRPSGSTLGKWIREFEVNGCDPIALADKYSKRRQRSHFTADQELVIRQAIDEHLRDTNPKKSKCHELLEKKVDEFNAKARRDGREEITTVPSLRTIQNRINLIPGVFRDVARLGEDEAIRLHGNGSEGLDVVRPLERLELDEHLTDLQTLLVAAGVWETLNRQQRRAVKRTRLWITAIIDVATRYVLALRVHAEAPSARTAVATLEMTTHDKTQMARALGCETPWDGCGTGESLAVDSAAWLAGMALRLVATDLGTVVFLPAAGEAHLRGTIERVFQTMEGAFEFFSGKTWWSVTEKGEYDSEKNASVIAAKMTECLTRYVVDYYHNRRHTALGMSPREKWRELVTRYGVLPPPTGARRRAIFGINLERVITKKGILAHGIWYNSRQLQQYARMIGKRPAFARVDSYDLGAASVLTDSGWINVPAVEDGLQGVSIWKYMAALEKIRAIGDRDAAINRKMFLKTIAWLHEQSEMTRLEAEVDAPLMKDVDFERIEKKLNRQFQLADDASEFPIDMETEWGPSPAFFELAGIDPLQFVEKKTKKAEPEPVRPQIASTAELETIERYEAMLRGGNPGDETAPAQTSELFDE